MNSCKLTLFPVSRQAAFIRAGCLLKQGIIRIIMVSPVRSPDAFYSEQKASGDLIGVS